MSHRNGGAVWRLGAGLAAILAGHASVAQLDRASVFGTEGCRFKSCRAYWRAIQWRSEARRDRDAGRQPAGSSPAGRIGERSSGGARPEGIATPESSLQVRVLPGVLKSTGKPLLFVFEVMGEFLRPWGNRPSYRLDQDFQGRPGRRAYSVPRDVELEVNERGGATPRNREPKA